MRKTLLTLTAFLVAGWAFAQKPTFEAASPYQEQKPVEKIHPVPFIKGTNIEPMAEQLSLPVAGSKAWTTPYIFVQESDTYVEITGGTVHGTTANDDQSFNAIDIGFPFTYNGTEFTQVSINSNGFAALGATVSSSYSALSGGTTNNVLSPLNTDLQGQTGSEIMTLLEGEAPNRIFTIQWKNYRYYGATGDSYNFQIKLYETSNRLAFVYGTFTKNATARAVQAGIRGAVAADFVNRTTTTNWAATTAGTVNTATCALSTTVLPVSGLKFIFREPFAVDAQITAIPSPANGLVGNYNVVATLKNNGTTEMTACDINWDINGAVGTYNWTGTIAAGATEDVTIQTGYDFTTVGDYIITITANMAGDENAANNALTKVASFYQPYAVPVTQNFDGVTIPALPNFWGRETTSVNWVTGNSGTIGAVSAPNFLALSYHSTLPKNDWAFTPFMALEAGKNYKLAFYVKAPGYSGVPEKMKVHLGAAQASASMDVDPIWNNDNMLIAAYTAMEVMFTVPTTGNYVIGFHGYSIADVNYIAIDNVEITEVIPVDVGISAIVEPAVAFYTGSKDVVATLKNFGSTEVTDVNIDWDINGTTGSYNWTGTLAGGATTNVTVTNFDFATAGDYTITVATDLGGDANADNDATTKVVTVYAPKAVPYTENFDGVTAPALPALWSVENGNSDTNLWITSASNAYSAPNAMAINYNGTLIMNDWAFSPLVALETGKTYKLSFYYRARSASYAEKLKVHIGTAAGSANMEIDPLVDLGAFTNATYILSETTFTVDADGNYCFGFHGYSDPDKYTLYFDNVSVVELYNNDVEVKSVIAPAFAGLDVPVELGAVVNNPGLSENTFDVTISVYDETDTEVYTNTESVTLDAGQQLAVALGEWIPTAEGTFSIEVEAELATDQNMSNNFAAKATDVVEGLLWGWNIDVTGSTSGIVATNLGALANGLIETADDFILPAGEWKIDSIATNGFKTGTTPDPTNFKVIVYANNEGAPGEVVYEAIVPVTNPTHQQLVFEEPLILEGGHYWLVVVGNYPTASALSAGRWNWKTMAPLFYGQAMLRDNPNVFGAGATNWTALTALGVNQGSTDFSIWGVPYVAYDVTVAVNPAGAGLVNGQESWNLYIEENTELELTASANEGFLFVNWTDGEANVMSIDATLTHTVVADIEINANFREVVSATIDPASGTTELENPDDMVTVITWNDATSVTSIILHDPSGDWELNEGDEYIINDIDGATAELTLLTSNIFSKKGVKATIDLDFEIFFDLGESAIYTLTLDLGSNVVVLFNVTDATTGDPIEDATFTIEGEEFGSGEYIFLYEPGTYNYSVARDGYFTFTGSFVVVDDNLTIDIALTPVHYDVTFVVVDQDSNPIDDAVIQFNGVTGDPGEYVFTVYEPGDYSYLISKDGYYTLNGIATVVDQDITVDITLVLITYTVTFNVVDADSNPITDAVVTFDGTAAPAGSYVFANLLPGTYSYSVGKDGYAAVTGDVPVIDADVTVPITLNLVGVNTNTFANFSAYPNPFSNSISISNPAVVSRVVVANIIGQNVLDITTNGAVSIETASLPAGVYLVTFEAANGERLVRKMVKK